MKKDKFRQWASFFLAGSFAASILLTDLAPAAQEETGLIPGEPRKISMDLDNAPVKDVLKIFSQQSGLNFIANKDIESKTVTVYFENVGVQDALDNIMTANNLSYYQEEGSDIFMVYASDSPTPKLLTKVFRLKYSRLSTSPIDVAGQRTVTDLLTSDIPKTSTQSSSSSTTATSTTGGSPSQQSFVQKGIDQLLASLLSPQGKLTVDLPTNSLIVTDTPEKLKRIEDVLRQIDVPTPQVVLEVYVMEVKKDILDNIGIEWGGNDGAIVSATGATLTSGYPFTSGLFKKDLNLPIKDPAFFGLTPSHADTPGGLTTGLLNATNLSATLHFIKTQTDTKILAQPRVLTQNNEAATIRLITNTGISITNVTVTTGAAPVTTATVERAELGISLKMTPQIDQDDSVQLFLEPAISTATPNNFLTGFNVLDPTTRIVRTVARVKDRQTLIIGGLMDTDRRQDRRKVPFLGDAPVFGPAFRYDTTNNADREILIFITPHILKFTDFAAETDLRKDLAAKRMLDSFMGMEMDKLLDTLKEPDKRKSGDRTHEKKNPPAGLKPASPAMDKEMDQTLNLLSFKNTKINR